MISEWHTTRGVYNYQPQHDYLAAKAWAYGVYPARCPKLIHIICKSTLHVLRLYVNVNVVESRRCYSLQSVVLSIKDRGIIRMGSRTRYMFEFLTNPRNVVNFISFIGIKLNNFILFIVHKYHTYTLYMLLTFHNTKQIIRRLKFNF